MATIVAPLQILAGDFHGLNTLVHQPAKIAAMEGHFETRRGAPLILFGWPDDDAETTRYALEIPKLGSLVLTHLWESEVKGLKAWPKAERPPAAILFWSFRVMVAIGFAMAAVGLWSAWRRLRSELYESVNLQRVVLMAPAGFIAVLAGWITTEVGRQPYTIYGLLTTAESISPLDAPAVGASLVAFIVVYFTVFGAGVFYILRLMAKSPDVGLADEDIGPTHTAGITPAPAVDADRILPTAG